MHVSRHCQQYHNHHRQLAQSTFDYPDSDILHYYFRISFYQSTRLEPFQVGKSPKGEPSGIVKAELITGHTRQLSNH